MADVRLTATNPADSSVVPVACNEKGELKLEEIPDQSFDGNLQGDLTVSGNAEFAGNVTTGEYLTGDIGSSLGAGGALYLRRSSNRADKIGFQLTTGVGTANEGVGVQFNCDGSAEFADTVDAGKFTASDDGGSGVTISRSGVVTINRSSGDVFRIAKPESPSESAIKFTAGGKADFANGKAGFTAEGYLWCTTRRGDTVILDATSNGLASWVPYTPPNRLTELQDQWAEKDGILPVPHESSQDEPETTQ